MTDGTIDRVIRAKEVAKKIGVTPQTIENWVRAGIFPAPKRIGRTKYWRESVVDEWVNSVFPAAKKDEEE
jgi:predicted DNA-binding transcriptional regulator AlpA